MPKTTDSTDRLTAKLRAYRLAFGEATKHAHVQLMESAAASGDAAVIDAVLAHVDANAPKGRDALAVIGSEISKDPRSPTLWCEIDIQVPDLETPFKDDLARLNERPTLHRWLSRDGAIRSRYTYRRESDRTFANDPLAVRMLVPPAVGLNVPLIELAARMFGQHNVAANPVHAAPHAEALLSAAVLRASTK